MKAMPKHGRFVLLRRLCGAALLTLLLPAAWVRADNVGAPAGVLGRHKVGFSVNSGVFQRDIEFERALKNVEARAGQPVPPDQRDQVYRGVLDGSARGVFNGRIVELFGTGRADHNIL